MTERDRILLNIPAELVGERLVVRGYRPGDGVQMFEAVDASRAHLAKRMPWISDHTDPASSEVFVRKSMAKFLLREDLTMGIFLRESGKLVGATGLHRCDWNVPSAEIGYWIRPDEEGKGYVTEAVKLLLDLAFHTVGFLRVDIRCAEENLRSRAVPERLGFKFEGIMENELREADGEVVDVCIYSMTPDRYKTWLNSR